jgi:hypothetical protein
MSLTGLIRFNNNMKKSKKIQLAVGVVGIVAVAVFWKQFFALAQSVIDSFNDSSKIAATWQAEVDTVAGVVRPSEKSCDPLTWFCSESTRCANTLGDGTHIVVRQGDAPSTLAWKNANTACDQPQCGIDGGQNGDNLKADNTIVFGATYPAREYCKSIGGRLPTLTELQCIYTNRAYFGSFGTGFYWSSTENSSPYASHVFFGTGSSNNENKSFALSVRCVRGW